MAAVSFHTSMSVAPAVPVRSWLAGLGQRLWQSLEAMGQARANNVLRERAAYYAAWNPGLAAQLLAVAKQGERSR